LYALLFSAENSIFEDAWWSPDLRAGLCLPLFLGTDWKNREPTKPSYFIKEDPDGSLKELKTQVKEMLDLVPARAERHGEILQQADDMVWPWQQLLNAHSGRRPATAALVHLCLSVAGHIGMYWKRHFKAPRPAQIYPALVPIVPTPRHPAYPSNHSFQSHLIPEMMHVILGDLEDKKRPEHGIVAVAKAFANRVAENREIAGVHFKADSDVGKKLANDLVSNLWLPMIDKAKTEEAKTTGDARDEFAKLVQDIRREWQASPTPLAESGEFEKPGKVQRFNNLIQEMEARKPHP
jgi:hypothetical protein